MKFHKKQKCHKLDKRTGQIEKQWSNGAPKIYTVKEVWDNALILYNCPEVLIGQSGEVLTAPSLLKSNWADCKLIPAR